MANSIYLEERKIDNEVIEGSLNLNMSPSLTKDIVINIPNENGEYVSKESLETGEFNISILGGSEILKPIKNEENSIGIFRVGSYTPIPTYTRVPDGYVLEVAKDASFTNIIKTFTRTDFNSDFMSSFDNGGQTLYARVRTFTDAHNSINSTPTRFKLIDNYVHKPTILTPIHNSNNNPFSIQVTLSDYSYIGKDNYCDGLVYEVSTDMIFSNMVDKGVLLRDENEGEVIDYNNYVKSFMLEKLSEDTLYYLRVAYIGKESSTGEWSDTTIFRTYNLPDMKITTNLGVPSYITKVEEDNIFATVSGNIINLLTTDNNFNTISSNKNITYNEPDLTKINVNKILVDANKDIFIFGTMEYGGVNYIGPLKKQFITKYSNGIVSNISIEVDETIVTEIVDGKDVMVPYISKVDFKNSILYKDVIVVFGTIPHPTPSNDSTLVSCYVINKSLNILTFKNFSKSNKIEIDNLTISNDKIMASGYTIGDVGYGPKKQGLIIAFDVSDDYILSIDNAKLYSTTLDSKIGNTIDAEDGMIIAHITTSNNFVSGTTTILKLDEYNMPIEEISLDTNLLISSLIKKDNGIRLLGKNDIHGNIIDIDNENNVSLSKQFLGFGEIINYKDLGNNIVTIKSKNSNELLLINGNIDLTTNVTDISIPISITSNTTISVPTIDIVTHEPIRQNVNSVVTNGATNTILKTNI